jgi:hypothetical protein
MVNPFETFEVTGVTWHTGILFHPGNTEKDSSGCILLGTGINGFTLSNSREAFAFFMSGLEGLDTFNLTVV